MTEPAKTQPGAGELRVISADTLVEGTHFQADTDPGAVAAKSLAVNLSDLAAMGAEPLSVSLMLADPDRDPAWARQFLTAFESCCRHYRVELSGVEQVPGPRHVSIQAVGRVPAAQALRRDRARPGDYVYVSGTLGDAGLGLDIINAEIEIADSADRNWCLERLHRPTPRIELGMALRGLARCAIDVSDGLAGDLGHLCERSRVGMEIQARQLPLSTVLRRQCPPARALDLALSAGDDYELCFTAGERAVEQIGHIGERLGLLLSAIGRVVESPGLRIHAESGQLLPVRPAYQHFLDPGRAQAT